MASRTSRWLPGARSAAQASVTEKSSDLRPKEGRGGRDEGGKAEKSGGQETEDQGLRERRREGHAKERGRGREEGERRQVLGLLGTREIQIQQNEVPPPICQDWQTLRLQNARC